MKLDELLKGDYGGLYGEVVTEDCYSIGLVKDLDPDVVFDVGANIGIFSRHARSVWPRARIVALEPDPRNVHMFREYTNDPNLVLVHKALGRGRVYHATTARNGSGEVYLSPGLGYPSADLEAASSRREGIEHSFISCVSLADLVREQFPDVLSGARAMLKMDCEGGENSVWTDRDSMDVLSRFEYVAAEIHFYAHTGSLLEEVWRETHRALDDLSRTHTVLLEGVHLWAIKK